MVGWLRTSSPFAGFALTAIFNLLFKLRVPFVRLRRCQFSKRMTYNCLLAKRIKIGRSERLNWRFLGEPDAYYRRNFVIRQQQIKKIEVTCREAQARQRAASRAFACVYRSFRS